jgi:hypothetical protein
LEETTGHVLVLSTVVLVGESVGSSIHVLTSRWSVAVADLRQAALADVRRAAVKEASELVKKSLVKQVTAQVIARGLAEKAAERVGGGVGHAAVKLGGLALRGEVPSRNDMIEVAATTTIDRGPQLHAAYPFGGRCRHQRGRPRLRKWLDSRS